MSGRWWTAHSERLNRLIARASELERLDHAHPLRAVQLLHAQRHDLVSLLDTLRDQHVARFVARDLHGLERERAALPHDSLRRAG